MGWWWQVILHVSRPEKCRIMRATIIVAVINVRYISFVWLGTSDALVGTSDALVVGASGALVGTSDALVRSSGALVHVVPSVYIQWIVPNIIILTVFPVMILIAVTTMVRILVLSPGW